MALARMPQGLTSVFFGNEGRVTAEFGVPSAAYVVEQAYDNPVRIAGSAGDDFAWAAFDDDDGQLVAKATVSFDGPAVARSMAGNLLAGEVRDGAGTSVAVASLRPDGTLDPAFGSAGRMVDDVTPQVDAANAISALPAGHGSDFLVAGQAGEQAMITRYQQSGQLQTRFGAGGRVLLDLTPAVDVIRDLLVTYDGSILVAGSAGANGFMARFDAAGAPDVTFGDGGVSIVDAGSPVALNSLSALPGNVDVMVAAGTVQGPDGTDALVVRHQDGVPDPAFGSGGTVTVDLGSPADSVGGLVFDNASLGTASTSSLVTLAGGDGEDMVLAKLGPTGETRSFTPQEQLVKIDFGRPSSESGAHTVVQPDGQIVVAGRGGSGLLLTRFRDDGRLDPSFHGGRVDVPEAGNLHVTDLALQGDGRIVVAAKRLPSEARMVLRFLADGALDSTFGVAGKASVNGEKIAVQPDGRILVLRGPRLLATGQPDPTYPSQMPAAEGAVGLLAMADGSSVVVRSGPTFTSGPTLTRFDAGGTAQPTPWSPSPSEASDPIDMDRLPDGRIVVVSTPKPVGSWGGTLANPQPPSRLMVIVFLADGRPDTRFGPFGTRSIRLADWDVARSVVAQPDGKIVVGASAGYGDRTVAELVRLLPDGRRDVTFGAGGVVQTDRLYPASLAVGAQGSVVVAGNAENDLDLDLAVARYSPVALSTRPPRSVGWNGVGQLGDATTVDRHHLGAVTDASGLQGVTSLSAGFFHGLALAGDGTVWSWGWNAYGQLGDGTTIDRAAPVKVPGLDHVIAVAAGGAHSLALKEDGTVWAWGWNGLGQLGDGTTISRVAPVRLGGLAGAKLIAAGGYHSHAVAADGAIWSWGWNAVGQLGTSSTTDSRVPKRTLVTLPPITSIAGGAFHSLAVDNGGRVYAWGWNVFRQLGHDSPFDTTRPSPVEGLGDAISVAAGYIHSTALKSDGSVWSWGSNVVGQFGSASTVDSQRPVAAQGLSGVAQIAAGFYHTLAMKADGSTFAWGWNAYGQLGTGGTADSTVPVALPATRGVITVSAGGLHTLTG